MNLLAYAWALPLVPLVVFVFVLASGRRLPRMVAPVLGIAAMAVVFVASCAILWATAHGARFSAEVSWIHAFGVQIDVGFLVDPLSSLMLFVVSLVSMLVQIYSIGYMETEERFRWYFGAISLFTAAMLGVVLSDNWLLMYMCWEIMGLASFLLIGFWYETPTASAAAMKAFVVTRLGDVGFGLGLGVMWVSVGTFTFDRVFHAVELGAWGGPTLIAASLLLFMGAMGKSAQFPLHVWLPDAMAGPTPGSALIHAATMVAAGVYLVARSYPLFEANPATLEVVATIGAITAVMAALIALAMDDIKKVLAYSTISQLGYMMIALGVGSWPAAIFHLMTHAFFKALLFLTAGSVIHGTHTQDIREMGGLWKKMPWTTATWVIGSLALAGIPPLAGFWSKDEILLSAMNSGHTVILIAGLGVAALTAFYMGRTTFLAFFAKPGPTSKSEHAHESSAVMTGPLVTLSAFALFAGLVGSPMMGNAFAAFLGEKEAPTMNYGLAGVAVAAALVGIGYAWFMYLRGSGSPDWYVRNKNIGPALLRSFWIDDAYQNAIVAPAMWVAGGLRKLDAAVVDGVVRGFGRLGMWASGMLAVFDRKGVDGAVDGIGHGIIGTGRQVRRIETGNVQTYLMLLVISIIVLVVVFAMTGLPILSIIVLAPVAGALLVGLFGGLNPKLPRWISLVVSAISLGGSLWVYLGYDRVATGYQYVEQMNWIPALGAKYILGVDGLSAPMLLLTSLVIFAGTFASWDYEERTQEFFALLLLLVTGVLGVFASVDAFLLFFFYEMAVLPMYLLIAIWGSTRKEYSAMKLTLFLFAGSAMLVVVLVSTYWAVGAHTFDMRIWAQHSYAAVFQRWVFLLAVLGFGTLIPIWPLHTWSPDGHVAAPTVVSMLHAGVLLKIGAYGLMRLGLTMFPVGWADWRLLLAAIGVINVVYGAFCAMSQTDLKYVIGYSSVSHMGYVILGMAVGDRFGMAGAGFQMFAHGVMTALFFTLIGFVYEQMHTREIAKISGLMRQVPLVAACFVIAGASSMGLPSTAGFVSELLVYVGLVMRSPWLAALAFLGVVATATYVLRLLSRILLGEPSEVVLPIHDARPLRFVPMALLAGTIMLVGILPASLYSTVVTGVAPIVAKLAGG